MSNNDEQEHNNDNLPDHAGVAFHPPLMLGILLAVGFGLRALVPLPIPLLPEGIASIGGPTIVVVALVLAIWAARTMRAGGASIPTNESTDAIVSAGPYKFSRNPIYLAMVVLLVGVGVWANSLWLIGMAVRRDLLSWGVISREYLRRKFGAEYSAYTERVVDGCSDGSVHTVRAVARRACLQASIVASRYDRDR